MRGSAGDKVTVTRANKVIKKTHINNGMKTTHLCNFEKMYHQDKFSKKNMYLRIDGIRGSENYIPSRGVFSKIYVSLKWLENFCVSRKRCRKFFLETRRVT